MICSGILEAASRGNVPRFKVSTDQPLIFSPTYYRTLAHLERTHPWFAGTRRIASAIIAAVLGSPSGGLRVLDVGCGTGATMEWLEQFAGNRPVIGIDLAVPAVKLAQRVSGDAALASADALPFGDSRFDLIYCADVVQHLNDSGRFQALQEFARVLRPGGAIAVRSNLATGAPDQAASGYEAFDYRRFPDDIRRAGLQPIITGRVSVLTDLSNRLRRRSAGGGWTSQGLKVQQLGGPQSALGLVLSAGFLVETLAFKLRGRLPVGIGASSFFAAIKAVPFERA